MFVDEEGREVEPPGLTKGVDYPGDEERPDARTQMLQEMIGRGRHDDTADFALIRRHAMYDLTEASLIFTPIHILELFKLDAEQAFMQNCARAVGVKTFQGWDDITIGKYLAEIFNRAVAENKDETAEELRQDCIFNLSFAVANGLAGIFYVKDLRFSLPAGVVHDFLWTLSFKQLKTVDVLHLHAAHMLGCDYFAALDNSLLSDDRQFIENLLSIKLLCGVQEVMDIMKKHRKKQE
jgi:hypothetical protein